MTDLISYVFDYFLYVLCAGSRRRFLWCQNGKFNDFWLVLATDFEKYKIWKSVIFGRFWSAGGSYLGGKNLPLSISHRFAASKAQNDIKKSICGLNTNLFSNCLKKIYDPLPLWMGGIPLLISKPPIQTLWGSPYLKSPGSPQGGIPDFLSKGDPIAWPRPALASKISDLDTPGVFFRFDQSFYI